MRHGETAELTPAAPPINKTSPPNETGFSPWEWALAVRPPQPAARGYGEGKKANGSKRYVVVDTIGLLVVVLVTTRQVRLNLGGSVYEPNDAVGRLLFNVLAMVAPVLGELVGSDGGDAVWDHPYTLTVTDNATRCLCSSHYRR